MEEDEDSNEKTEEPSQQRLEEFREKGIVANSREVASFFVLCTGLFTLVVTSVYSFQIIKEFFEWSSEIPYDQAFNIAFLEKIILKSLKTILSLSAPVLLVTLLFGVFSNIFQIGFVFAPEVLTFDIDKLNPLKGIQKIVSRKIFVELAKNIVKFCILICTIYIFLKKNIDHVRGLFQYEIFQSIHFAKIAISQALFVLLLGILFLAIIDYIWEKYSYRQKLLLTKQQAKEEMREKEGNPEIKQKIRTIQRAFANRKTMNEVKKADVIIANPTHISIALKYDKESMVAPKVIAKGVDFIALKMREVAGQNKVPVVENIDLARNLYKTVKVGQYVPRNLYKAVAEILAYVYKLRKREKAISS